MYRRDAGQLRRVTGDLRVESELVDHCHGELSEDGDCRFDRYGMLTRHVGPVGTRSVCRATCNCPHEIEGEWGLTSQ